MHIFKEVKQEIIENIRIKTVSYNIFCILAIVKKPGSQKPSLGTAVRTRKMGPQKGGRLVCDHQFSGDLGPKSSLLWSECLGLHQVLGLGVSWDQNMEELLIGTWAGTHPWERYPWRKTGGKTETWYPHFQLQSDLGGLFLSTNSSLNTVRGWTVRASARKLIFLLNLPAETSEQSMLPWGPFWLMFSNLIENKTVSCYFWIF